MSQENDNDLQLVIGKVQSMVYDKTATKIIRKEKYSIHNVTWEDCARNKGSVWGPCISDMTLQVGDSRMPVIRKDNFTDLTWDIALDKIPVVVGNEQLKEEEKEEKDKTENKNDEMVDEKSNEQKNNNKKQNGNLQTVSLKEYLKNFDKYMSQSIRSKKENNKNDNNNNNGGGLFASINIFGQSDNENKLNLLRKDESKDSHCIVSSQACFLPIAKGKETLFNVALFNYQSRKDDPAVLAIVATSKGTSAQIIQGSDQKLLFNNNGMKADFIGQRLSDNRIERGIKNLEAPMTTEEKQDNCIVIIQVPLKQKKRQASMIFELENELYDEDEECCLESAPMMMNQSSIKKKSKKKEKENKKIKKNQILNQQLLKLHQKVIQYVNVVLI